MMKQALILANGDPPNKRLLQRYTHEYSFIVCADGGANIAMKLGSTPNIIIGDLDSIHPKTLRYFHNVKIKKLPDQNSTDLEKAFAYAIRNRYNDIIVLGGTGGRIDHEAGNLSALAKFSRRAKIKFIDEHGELVYINREQQFHLPLNTIISLIPLSHCTGIVTSGLKWNLKNESLRLGFRDSTSNIIVASPVTIKVRTGDLLAFIVNSH
jgi:thiamine pyrophosphokinase